MIKVTFRKPKREEYPEFVRVVNSEKKQYQSVYTPRECGIIGIGRLRVRDMISGERPGRGYLVAMINNKIVGTASYYLKGNNVIWISMFAVLPACQRKKVGTKLLKEIEKRAKRLKAKAIALNAVKKAVWAVSFYKVNGYRALRLKDFTKRPFKGTLQRKPVKHAYVFGKIL